MKLVITIDGPLSYREIAEGLFTLVATLRRKEKAPNIDDHGKIGYLGRYIGRWEWLKS